MTSLNLLPADPIYRRSLPSWGRESEEKTSVDRTFFLEFGHSYYPFKHFETSPTPPRAKLEDPPLVWQRKIEKQPSYLSAAPASSHLLRGLAAASASLLHQPSGIGERMFCNSWLELPGAEQETSSGTRSSRSNRGSSWKLSQIRYFPLSPLPSPSTPLLFPSLLTPFPPPPPPAFSLALSTPLCTENFFLWVHLAPEHSSCVRLSHVTKFS